MCQSELTTLKNENEILQSRLEQATVQMTALKEEKDRLERDVMLFKDIEVSVFSIDQ